MSPRRALSRLAGPLLLAAACAEPAAPDLAAEAALMGARKKPTSATPTTTTPSANPLAGLALYVDPYSSAAAQADAWRAARPADALQMDKVAAQPQARWFGNWNTDVRADADRHVGTAAAAGRVPVLVAYNVPNRDCGGYSGANATTPDGYRAWVRALAEGIGTRRAVVVLEPDALALMDCLGATDRQLRFDLLKEAVAALTARGTVSVYLDAGHSAWHPAATMASRLTSAGVAGTAGFALNVSNFRATAELVAYGNALSPLVGGKHYVLDVSRNGLGPTPDSQWCNPEGRALGVRPTTATGEALADAFLWVKTPGESDGACNGAPPAGAWMPEYALGLAQRASW